MGRTNFLNAGSFAAKRATPDKHEIPPMQTVAGAPILPARWPADKLPNGAIPMNDVAKKLMTLPRLSSSTIVCRVVSLDAI